MKNVACVREDFSMIDLHSHILPGIDDGAKDLSESLAMLKLAYECGTQVIVATPHMQPGVYNNDKVKIQSAYKQVQEKLNTEDIDLELKFAAEVHLCPEVMLWAEKGELPFIGQYDGYRILLLELPHSSVPLGTSKLIKWLLHNNIRPMIAHPERNRAIRKEPYHLKKLAELGCLFQVTADSLVGNFRKDAQDFAIELLKNGLVHCVASDCHGIEKRSPDLSPAYKLVRELSSQKYADELFIHFPKQILGLL